LSILLSIHSLPVRSVALEPACS